MPRLVPGGGMGFVGARFRDLNWRIARVLSSTSSLKRRDAFCTMIWNIQCCIYLLILQVNYCNSQVTVTTPPPHRLCKPWGEPWIREAFDANEWQTSESRGRQNPQENEKIHPRRGRSVEVKRNITREHLGRIAYLWWTPTYSAVLHMESSLSAIAPRTIWQRIMLVTVVFKAVQFSSCVSKPGFWGEWEQVAVSQNKESSS